MRLFLFMFLIPTLCFSQLRDYDKHFIAGVVTGAITIPVAHKLGAQYPEGWAVILGFMAGTSKELLDHYIHRKQIETEVMHWDHISDWFATFSGSMTLAIAIGPILSHKRKTRYLLPEHQ